MIRVKRREFTGDVCEQIVYNVPDGTGSLWRRELRPRFETQQERDDFNAADVDEDSNPIYLLRHEEFIGIVWAVLRKILNRLNALEARYEY